VARRAGIVTVLLAAALLAVVTWRRNEDFATETRLWTETVRYRPNDPCAHNNLGSALVLSGQVEASIPQFEAALRVAPAYTPAHRNLGSALLRLGHADEALRHIREALRLDPHDGLTHYKLGQALQVGGDRDAALAAYETALQLDPTLVMAHQNAGIALLDAQRFAAAAEHFSAGLKLDPDHVGTLTNLAWLRATCPDSTLRDGAAAVREAEKAARLTQRRDPEVLDVLAAAYAEAGRFDDALAVLQELHRRVAGDTRAPLARLEKCRRLYMEHRPYRIGM
jgi:pentatricopeptide repeat protein